VRIAAELVSRLLNSSDPAGAVHQLDGFWCTRQGRTADQPWFGLSAVEFRVHLFLLYVGEVGNGGHAQFFLNPTGAYVADTIDALEALGMQDLRSTLAAACQVFPDAHVPPDEAAREKAVGEVGSSGEAEWERCDRQVYALEASCWPTALEYLRVHRTEVLVHERE
jgi:Domain of unknown function (DUF4375)